MFLGALWRFRGRVENEIGKGGNLGTILVAAQCLSAPRGSVDVTQMAQASRLGYRVRLEPQSSNKFKVHQTVRSCFVTSGVAE